MRILTRYILLELLKVFSLTLVSMTTFVFLVLIGKEAVENGLGLVPILRMVPYMLPQAMQFAVPGTMLLAATSVYGRVASSNEVVAVKSLGISPMTLVWPTLVLATLVSFGAVVLNDVAVSWGRIGVQRVILDSLEEIAYGRLKTTRSYSGPRTKVSVMKVVGKRLIQPIFVFNTSGDGRPWTVTADQAQIEVDLNSGNVLLTLYNAEGDLGGRLDVTGPGESQYQLPLSDFSGGLGSSRSTSNYSLQEIGPTKKRQHAEINRLQEEMVAEVGFSLITGQSHRLAQADWQYRERGLDNALETLHRLDAEPHRRWSGGFSCLCFVMIGAPMAIKLRNGEFWGTFFICFVPIVLVYYPMLASTVDFAKEGILPPQGVWAGNLILAGFGVYLMRNIIRH